MYFDVICATEVKRAHNVNRFGCYFSRLHSACSKLIHMIARSPVYIRTAKNRFFFQFGALPLYESRSAEWPHGDAGVASRCDHGYHVVRDLLSKQFGNARRARQTPTAPATPDVSSCRKAGSAHPDYDANAERQHDYFKRARATARCRRHITRNAGYCRCATGSFITTSGD